MTADDGNGGTVSDSFTVRVKAAPVVASALTGVSLEEDGVQDVSLSGVFSDADGDTLTITTNSSNETVANAFAFQDTLTITAFDAGTATITVTARDADGNTVSDAFDVSVTAPQQNAPPPNQAPTVSSAIGDVTIVTPAGAEAVALAGVFDDAEGDSLAVTAVSSNTAVARVAVDAGYSGLTVTAKSRGTATVTVTADDGNGGTVSDSFTVTVKAAPVVASVISDVSGLTAGTTQDVSLSGVFTDADGDALTITAGSSISAVATVSVAAGYSRLTVTGAARERRPSRSPPGTAMATGSATRLKWRWSRPRNRSRKRRRKPPMGRPGWYRPCPT